MQFPTGDSLSGERGPAAEHLPARWAASGGGESLDSLWRLLHQRERIPEGHVGVSRLDHGLRCASLAAKAGAADTLVLAALLHDVGSMLERDFCPRGRPRSDRRHLIGAAFLSLWFGPEVTEPVRMHVEARQFLVATEPGYAGRMNGALPAKKGRQLAPMSAEVCRAFLGRPHARDAILLCRWQDRANHEPVECLELSQLHVLAQRCRAASGSRP